MAEIVEQDREATLVPGADKPATAPATPAPEAAKTDEAPPAGEKPADQPKGADKPDTDDHPESRHIRRDQRRINAAYRREAQARAEADQYRRQLEELKRPTPDADPSAPRADQFTDYEQYIAAREQYAATKAVQGYEQRQRTQIEQHQNQLLLNEWEAKVERGVERYDDFEEIVGDLKPNQPWSAALMQAENGDDIAHYLGTHIKETQKIIAMSPVQQVLAIGKLAAKIAAEPSKVRMPSKAPAPITPVSAASADANAEPPTSDTKAWIAWRSKQAHKR